MDPTALPTPLPRRRGPPARLVAAAAMLLAVVLALPPAARAQTACRTDALGATICDAPRVPRPRPRPLFDDGTRGLDRVQERPPAGGQAPALIPGWRTNAFGRTLLGPGEAPAAGRCRPDALGNTRCR